MRLKEEREQEDSKEYEEMEEDFEDDEGLFDGDGKNDLRDANL
jgi:hypothetical protein